MTSTPLDHSPRAEDPIGTYSITVQARARALELLGAYTADLGIDERRQTLERVVSDVDDDLAAVSALVHALTEYAATFADVAATATSGASHVAPATLVHALARMDLSGH